MKKLLVFLFLIIGCRCLAQDSSSVQLLMSNFTFLVKIDGKEVQSEKQFRVTPGIHRITVYKPVVGVYDTLLSCMANTTHRLLVTFSKNPEYRADINKRNWNLSQKIFLYTAAVAIIPLGFKGFGESRKAYLDAYSRLQDAPGIYDQASSVSELANAKETMRVLKKSFADAKKDYRNSCLKAGGTVLLSGLISYLAIKIQIPVIEDKAKIKFDAISINGSPARPGFKFTVQL